MIGQRIGPGDMGSGRCEVPWVWVLECELPLSFLLVLGAGPGA
jgi:hypothetical protein